MFDREFTEEDVKETRTMKTMHEMWRSWPVSRNRLSGKKGNSVQNFRWAFLNVIQEAVKTTEAPHSTITFNYNPTYIKSYQLYEFVYLRTLSMTFNSKSNPRRSSKSFSCWNNDNKCRMQEGTLEDGSGSKLFCYIRYSMCVERDIAYKNGGQCTVCLRTEKRRAAKVAKANKKGGKKDIRSGRNFLAQKIRINSRPSERTVSQ